MKKREGAILSAYTGIMLCDWDDYSKYVEELFNRPLMTHEFINMEYEIKKLSEKDFKEIIKNLED